MKPNALDAEQRRDPWPICMAPSDTGFRANSAERLIEPRSPSSPAAPRRALALFGACLIHASVLSILLFENWHGPAVAPATLEMPVEIVVEPPPKARSVDEEPAFDAPRAANKEKIARDAPGEESKASPAPEPMKQANPGLAPAESAGPTQQGERNGAENSAGPALDRPDAEVIASPGLEREKPEQREARADKQAEPENLATFGGEPFPAWSIGHPSTFGPLPGLEIAGAAESTPIGGGNAKATYLSIVYGMVMSHMHSPVVPRANLSKLAEGAIVFSVDGTGAITERKIARSSGMREFDSAALAAIAQAAPFPAPPGGAPIGLRFTYSAK